MQRTLLALAWTLCSTCALAQGGALPEAMRTIATVPANGLEGLDVAPDGTLLVTNATTHEIHRVDANGTVTRFARLNVVPQVILLTPRGALVTAQAREPDFAALAKTGQPPSAQMMGSLGAILLELDHSGHVTREIHGPAGAFFNGMDRLGRAVLIADSTAATIWRADIDSGSLRPWLKSPLLAGIDGRFPGANGLKVANGYVFVSNTTANALYRIAIGAGTKPDGPLERIATVAAPDDFAVAANGTIYLPSDGLLLEISPQGVISTLATGCVGCDAALLAEGGRAVLAVTHGFGPEAGSGHIYRLVLPQ